MVHNKSVGASVQFSQLSAVMYNHSIGESVQFSQLSAVMHNHSVGASLRFSQLSMVMHSHSVGESVQFSQLNSVQLHFIHTTGGNCAKGGKSVGRSVALTVSFIITKPLTSVRVSLV